MAKAKKGFGESPERTRPAKDFLLAFEERVAEDDPAKVEYLVKVNLDKLNEDFLETLPKVFKQLTTGKNASRQEQTAALFANFGSFIQETPLGNRPLNLELSLAIYQLVLKVFTREDFLENWAGIQTNMGVAYGDRIRGDRANNLEQAILSYENALQIYTRDAFPQDWAKTQMNLGTAYQERIRGDRADNLEQAILSYESALQVHTREEFPQDWARSQMNLGKAENDQIRGAQD